MAVPFPRLLRPLLGAALTVIVASCVDVTAPTIEDTNFHPSLGVDLQASTKTGSGLYYRDLTVGSGATADSGSKVAVHYKLFNTNGSMWEESPATKPLEFTVVGPSQVASVVVGFNEGVTGMKVGGRRQLIIPPHLGYGNQWAGNIPPNSILVFEVTLVSVQ